VHCNTIIYNAPTYTRRSDYLRLSQDYYDLYIEHWEGRAKLVGGWKKRLEERVYSALPERERPVSWGAKEDLDKEEVERKSRKARKWRAGYVEGTLRGKRERGEVGIDEEGRKKKKKDKKSKKEKGDKKGGLTRKEQKGLGGNWALLQGKL